MHGAERPPLHDERVQPSILTSHSLLPGEQQPGLLQSPTQEPLSNPEKGGGALNGVEADQTLTPEDQKGGAFLNPQGQGAEYGVGTLKPPIPENPTGLERPEIEYEGQAAVLTPMYSTDLKGSKVEYERRITVLTTMYSTTLKGGGEEDSRLAGRVGREGTHTLSNPRVRTRLDNQPRPTEPDPVRFQKRLTPE